mmetsp:Transcript_70467/g.204367  ORF Transcript_70467/g.204367 Transcript_70467/m.204367 type:complete len:173 (-) Transcript_70467:342-860(-)
MMISRTRSARGGLALEPLLGLAIVSACAAWECDEDYGNPTTCGDPLLGACRFDDARLGTGYGCSDVGASLAAWDPPAGGPGQMYVGCGNMFDCCNCWRVSTAVSAAAAPDERAGVTSANAAGFRVPRGGGAPPPEPAARPKERRAVATFKAAGASARARASSRLRGAAADRF